VALAPGTRLGPYEIVSALDAGGMGEVYQARDTRLGRAVAIKLLNAALSRDGISRERFEREARSIAALTHPHICTVHDVGDHEGDAFLVMELLEGHTLAARLARTKGGLPLDEALSIATDVVQALAFAHRHHITHRDIKPANIMLTRTGVKLLDFGLAQLRGQDDVAAHSRTQTSSTGPLDVMGTLSYMSPEQLDGRADPRSDIFGFGAVFFEMLTGRKAFDGATSSAVIGAVVHTDPPAVSSLRPDVSPALARLVRRCLAKEPEARWQSTADLLDEVRWIASHPIARADTIEPPVFRVRPLSAVIAIFGVAIVAAVLASARWGLAPMTPTPSETRTEIVTSATIDPTSFALSPDGRQIVFVASGGGASRLWLRSLATTTSQPLAGTEGAAAPFWSPDGRAVGFFAEGALKRLELGGGEPRTLAPAPAARGGTWSADGVIVFAPRTTGPLMRVAATGGDAAAVTMRGPAQQGRRWPHMVSDSRFLFYALDLPDTTGIYLGALDGSAPTRLTPADSAGVYLPGWLLWVRGGALVAQRLDVARAALTGDPVTLADGVAVDEFLRSGVSVASSGLVAYRTGLTTQRRLTWVDRSGLPLGTIGNPDGNNLRHPRVSPDGKSVAVSRTVQGNTDLWLLDGARSTRVTFDSALDQSLLWSPDGTRIVFETNRTGPFDLYETSTGTGVEKLVVSSDQNKVPSSWSKDGRFLLYVSASPSTGLDLWVVPTAGNDRTPSVFLKTPFNEAWGAFSPDGRWIAFQSNKSGPSEIYVRPFVPPVAPGATVGPGSAVSEWQVSTAGGVFPTWRPDGKELYYLNPEGAMTAATITVTGSTLASGAPVTLFPTRILGGGRAGSALGRSYDVAADGRFLINTVLDVDAAPITLLMNWRPPSP
jgi:serine/threonine protein kinase/Tol biopolymer transport system component